MDAATTTGRELQVSRRPARPQAQLFRLGRGLDGPIGQRAAAYPLALPSLFNSGPPHVNARGIINAAASAGATHNPRDATLPQALDKWRAGMAERGAKAGLSVRASPRSRASAVRPSRAPRGHVGGPAGCACREPCKTGCAGARCGRCRPCKSCACFMAAGLVGCVCGWRMHVPMLVCWRRPSWADAGTLKSRGREAGTLGHIWNQVAHSSTHS